MQLLPPPEAVLIEFLKYLAETVQPQEAVVIILRGSLLLRRWFGEHARPAADLDFECFERVPGGRGDRFMSLVDHARGLCCYATDAVWSRREATQAIEFDEVLAPADGHCLWTYGSPGNRFYAGWKWRGREGLTGQIQIDIAESASYNVSQISVADMNFVSLDGSEFRFPSYTLEMMLAAKLSWLLRVFSRPVAGNSGTKWSFEPKDLFDVHLLLTKADVNVSAFQKSLRAVAAEDQLDIHAIETLAKQSQRQLTDADFPGWDEFRKRNSALIASSPAEMLQAIAARLAPLLESFRLT